MTSAPLSCALLVLSLTQIAFAQAAPPRAAAPAASRPNPHALTLHCALGARPDLTQETLRAAIERELGVSVALSPDASGSPLKISVDTPGVSRVRFLNERGVSIERTVELPADTQRAVEVITWVTGNLARDEAASLIDQYRARAETETARMKAEAEAEAEAKARERAEAEAKAKPQPQHAAPATATPQKPPKPAKPEQKPELGPAQRGQRSYRNTLLNLSLFHPIALYRDSQERRFNFELGLVYGRIGALRGLSLELGLLRVDGPVEGVVLGGALASEGDVTGYLATLFYSGGRNLTGVDTTFVANWSGDLQGIELAVAFARTRQVDGVLAATGATLAKDVRGAQLAVGANVSSSVQGALLAAGANVSAKVTGVTAAAGANLVDSIEGASLAGLNLSQYVHGAQIGIVNIGGHVRGAQIGVINLARKMEGAGVGVINIAGNGQVAATAWANNFAPLHASIKFRSGYAYSEIGVGLDPASDEYLLESGAGAHIPIAGSLALEPGVHHSITKHTDERLDQGQESDRLHYRLRGVYGIGRRFDVFAGGGIRHGAWGEQAGEVDPEVFAGLGVH